MINISLKYFSIFNNKPSASWVVHITWYFLTWYSCSYYSSMFVVTNNTTYFKFRIIQFFFSLLNVTGIGDNSRRKRCRLETFGKHAKQNKQFGMFWFRENYSNLFLQKNICFCKLKLAFWISCFATTW